MPTHKTFAKFQVDTYKQFTENRAEVVDIHFMSSFHSHVCQTNDVDSSNLN